MILGISLRGWSVFLFGLCLLARSSPAAEEQWPEGYLAFLEPLTYPLSEWSPDDFGREQGQLDRFLLERYQPSIYLHPDQTAPVDFYREYLPQSVLIDPEDNRVKKTLDRSTLKKYERSFGYNLDYLGGYPDCQHHGCFSRAIPLYGRLFNERLDLDGKSIEVYVLKYTLVFPVSGLPVGRAWPYRVMLWMAGINASIWHQLDIHGAIHLFVEKSSLRPVMVNLAQHNHFKTYSVQELDWERDLHPKICFALSSNEPYPCSQEQDFSQHPATANPGDIAFLALGEGSPPFTGYDLVAHPSGGARPIDTRLEFLPDRDPLFVSWIDLGADLKILGFSNFYRSGPPGMNMNTHPHLKEYSKIASFWLMPEQRDEQLELMEQALENIFDDGDREGVGPRLDAVVAGNRKRVEALVCSALKGATAAVAPRVC